MKIFIYVFPMIFKSLMGPIKLRCDVPSGSTQGWVYLNKKVKEEVFVLIN